MAERREGVLGKSYFSIPFVLVCAAVAAAALAPLIKVVCDSISGKNAHLFRVFYWSAAAFTFLLFLAFHRYLKSQVKTSINPKAYPPAKPFLGGFLVGLASLLILAVVITLLKGGGFHNPRASTADFWKAFGIALGVSILVGFIEEIFFRGIMFQGLRADLGASVAAILAGIVYALGHFLRPRELPSVSGSDPLGGFKVMIHSLDRFGNFREIFPFAIGLFLIGILLTVAYLRTSALFLPMGLHAGFVFFAKLRDKFFAFGKKESHFFGREGAYPNFLRGVDATLMWMMVVVLTIVVALVGHKLQSKGTEGASFGKTKSKAKK